LLLFDHPPAQPIDHPLLGSIDFKMGIWDVITDIVEAASPWSVAEAEAVAAPAAESAQEEVRYPVELEGGALQLHAGLFEGEGQL